MSRRPVLMVLIAGLVGLSIGAATLTTAAPPTPSPTQVIGVLEVPGVEGSVDTIQHSGALELRSYDFEAAKPGGDPPVFRRMEVVVLMDEASPALLERLALGTVIPTVDILLIKPGEQPFTYKIFTLSNATVTSMREYWSGQSGDIALVQVNWKYKKIDVEYKTQSPTGGEGPSTDFCWSLKNEASC